MGFVICVHFYCKLYWLDYFSDQITSHGFHRADSLKSGNMKVTVLALAVQMASPRSWSLWPQNPALLAATKKVGEFSSRQSLGISPAHF